MPEAVLRGQGNEPAIDQLTGMPLTMEELLRRRGLVSYSGVYRDGAPLDRATGLPAGVAPNASQVAPTAPVAVDAASAAIDNANLTSVDPLAPTPVVANGQTGDGQKVVAPVATRFAEANAEINPEVLKQESGGVDKATLDSMSLPELEAWGKTAGVFAASVGTGMLLAYLNSRRQQAGLKPTAVPTVEGEVMPDGTRAAAGNIMEGEFTEVDPKKAGPNRLVGAESSQKALPAPRKNATSAQASASTSQAAAASADSDGTTKAVADRLRGKGIEQRGDTPKPRAQLRQERIERGARQANASRVQRPGTTPIVPDSFGALPANMQEEAVIRTQDIINERMQGRKESRKNNNRRAPSGRSTAPIDPEGVLDIVSRRMLEGMRNGNRVGRVRIR